MLSVRNNRIRNYKENPQSIYFWWAFSIVWMDRQTFDILVFNWSLLHVLKSKFVFWIHKAEMYFFSYINLSSEKWIVIIAIDVNYYEMWNINSA